MIIYPVDIVKRYSKEFQTEEGFRVPWQRVLGRARTADLVVKCCCPGTGDKRLSVRHYEERDSYGLARYPLTGEEHANDCRFYAPNPDKSGLSGYEKGVVNELSNGVVSVRLNIGLAKKDESEPAEPNPALPRGPGRKQAKMTLLGLLHFLWDRAGLNVWWPAMERKRNQGLVNAKLRDIARDVKAGRIELDKVLLLASQSNDDRWAELNETKVSQATDQRTRLVLIAPLAAFKADRATNRLVVKGFGGIPFLDIDPRLWDVGCNRYPRAFSTWREGGRVMVIAQIDVIENDAKNDKRSAAVLDFALMAVTDQWIPYDSGHEKRIAEKLVFEKRAFSKPLRFDAGEDEVFPDFILLDTGKVTPLEVFGRSDEPYEMRKADKSAYYNEKFGVNGWWCWNAARDPLGEHIPEFPMQKT